jgi:hypothetical protein
MKESGKFNDKGAKKGNFSKKMKLRKCDTRGKWRWLKQIIQKSKKL